MSEPIVLTPKESKALLALEALDLTAFSPSHNTAAECATYRQAIKEVIEILKGDTIK